MFTNYERNSSIGDFTEASTSDEVKNPSHYNKGTFEVIDEMLIVFGPQKVIDFCIINAWKYRARAPYKNNQDQDMAKADIYLVMAKEIADAYNINIPLIKMR